MLIYFFGKAWGCLQLFLNPDSKTVSSKDNKKKKVKNKKQNKHVQKQQQFHPILKNLWCQGQGVLEIMPFSDKEDCHWGSDRSAMAKKSLQEMESIEFVTESDILVMLQPEISLHKHATWALNIVGRADLQRKTMVKPMVQVSTRGMFAVVSWVLDEGPSTTRGWTGSISKTFGATAPAVKELQEWSQDRMEELAALHAAQQLENLEASYTCCFRRKLLKDVQTKGLQKNPYIYNILQW